MSTEERQQQHERHQREQDDVPATTPPIRKAGAVTRARKRQHRNRFTIITDILTLAKKGILKTHIMYGANLSFDQMKEYLGFLKEQNLLEEYSENDEDDGSNRMYRTTPKGLEYLKKYALLKDIASTNEQEATSEGPLGVPP